MQKTGTHKTMMSYETFTRVIDKLPFVKDLNLYRLGEPFLNQDIFDMMRYACDKNIFVSISTNFSFIRQDDFYEKIVRSGLQLLVVSLDGTTDASYSQYRKGGNFQLVLSNVKKMVETKKLLHSDNPKIVWQFIVNKYNEQEIEEARVICRELGVSLEILQMGLADELPDLNFDTAIEERKSAWLPANTAFVKRHYQGQYQYPLFGGICRQLFLNLNVAPDGKVFPCCWTVDKNNAFGDLVNESFYDIWHNQKYHDARRMFLKGGRSMSVCSRCNNFSKRPTFRDKVHLAVALINGIAQ
jgi:radical SAM protein with 4Fe4S-binding SPASM domain